MSPDPQPPTRPVWPFRVLWISILLLGLALFGAMGIVERLDRPYGQTRSPGLILVVGPGMSVRAIASRLEENGVISSALTFRAYVSLRSLDERLRAGEYEFQRPLSLAEVVEKLTRGQTLQHRLTIREGLDAQEIVQHLAGSGWGESEAFRKLVRSPGPIADLDPLASDLEGYLFPDTYLLTRGMSEEEIVLVLVNRFRSIWDQDRAARAKDIGMTLRQVVTMASLIEKETGKGEERPLISAVFHNRLRRKMKLACDPTVIYAVKRVKEYDGIIHQSDLRLDSPYNTYLYPGLPPGPIANPGVDSIDAALYPDPAEYLYFVSKNDGTHFFSKSYREHNRAVQQYQRQR